MYIYVERSYMNFINVIYSEYDYMLLSTLWVFNNQNTYIIDK